MVHGLLVAGLRQWVCTEAGWVLRLRGRVSGLSAGWVTMRVSGWVYCTEGKLIVGWVDGPFI